MNYAVIKASGKQYKVNPGLILEVDKIEGESGKELIFSDVLLTGDDNSVVVGTPVIKGATVKAKILEQTKGEKVRVGKFKAKAKYRRATGFRSQLTKIEITAIQEGTK